MQRTGSQGPPAVGGFAQTPQSVGAGGAQEPPTPASGAESQHEPLGKA
jgi:hypothetical protein